MHFFKVFLLETVLPPASESDRPSLPRQLTPPAFPSYSQAGDGTIISLFFSRLPSLELLSLRSRWSRLVESLIFVLSGRCFPSRPSRLRTFELPIFLIVSSCIVIVSSMACSRVPSFAVFLGNLRNVPPPPNLCSTSIHGERIFLLMSLVACRRILPMVLTFFFLHPSWCLVPTS